MKFTSTLALIFPLILAGCGGGGGGGDGPVLPPTSLQVVSFGDSLSDVGTYEVNGIPPVGPLTFGGGRYTTNPGQVWTERVAQRYGDSLSPAVRGGFGLAPAAAAGSGYAQGGAWVSQAVAPNIDGVLAQPVSQQLEDYLSRNGGFHSRQLILLNAGANDIINAVLAAYQGAIDPATVPSLVTRAANDMGDLLDRIVASGGQKIVLANVSDIGATPLAMDSPDLSIDLSAMSALFNDVLLRRVDSRPRPKDLVLIDSFRWSGDMVANYRQNGFKVGNQGVACSAPKILQKAYARGMRDPERFLAQNGLALLCAADTLTEPDADQNFMFADALHPSTRLHALFAQHVIQRLDARGF
ncbi:acylhydrolase [Xylophilus sp. Kf1]|nr:acylhydrolase [Xylophilus sp. Kf1]